MYRAISRYIKIKKQQKQQKSFTGKRAITDSWWVLSTMEVRYQFGWSIASKTKAQNPEQHF